jgi:hypothetical protein
MTGQHTSGIEIFSLAILASQADSQPAASSDEGPSDIIRGVHNRASVMHTRSNTSEQFETSCCAALNPLGNPRTGL